MDINKCADCYTVYCSFSESDRQKLEMFDEMSELLLHLRDDPFGMGSCYAKPKTYTEQQVEDMLRTLAKKIPCYACDAKCCDDNLYIPCIDRKIEYAKNNPTEETANE
jgi:hypothetical protein